MVLLASSPIELVFFSDIVLYVAPLFEPFDMNGMVLDGLCPSVGDPFRCFYLVTSRLWTQSFDFSRKPSFGDRVLTHDILANVVIMGR